MAVAKKKAPKTFKGKSMKLGGGGRFAKVESKIEAEGKSPKVAKAEAASIGRKKLGNAKMNELAKKGEKAKSSRRPRNKGR
jgi:hypothetical protein